MRALRFAWITLVLFASLVTAPASAFAQDAAAAQALRAEIDQLKRDFETRMSALESRLAAISGGQTVATPNAPAPPAGPTAEVPAGAQGAGGPTGALPVYGNVSAASKIFNPDMAVIGNFLGAAGKNEIRPSPALELPETEMSLQAIVDPYARADFFISFAEEGVSIEEGFVTFPTLPGGLLAKVGKVRAAFGKVNTLHTHRLTWTDRPLVTQNLVGGEEGIADAGISVARLIPNPWVFLASWSGPPGAATSVTSGTCAGIRTSPRTPTSIWACRTRRATTRQGSSPERTLDDSRRLSSALTRRCDGDRCSDPSITRSWGVPSSS
jgi:hypothetical protein